MSLRDTFEVYNPITLAVGCLFLGCGVWVLFEVLLNRHLNVAMLDLRAAIGLMVMFALVVLIPIALGAAIIHNQLRLRKIDR